jgi:CRP/FNR family transcriptional regulator
MAVAPRQVARPRNGNGKATALFNDPVPPGELQAGSSADSAAEGSARTDPHEPKARLLASVPLFADLPPGVLRRIVDRCTWGSYQRRQVIHFPGDPADAVFVVRHGRIKISRLSEDGKEATLTLVGPGEPFGEECLLDATTRETIAEALEPAQILRIPREDPVPLIHAHPAFALAVAHLMSGRRRVAESRLEEMVFKTVRSRLAALLARLARSHGRPTPGGILLDMSLAHQDLAGQIGSTRETTTLTLNQFRRRGLLSIDHCRILIRDLVGLEAIA